MGRRTKIFYLNYQLQIQVSDYQISATPGIYSKRLLKRSPLLVVLNGKLHRREQLYRAFPHLNLDRLLDEIREQLNTKGSAKQTPRTSGGLAQGFSLPDEI